MKEEWMKYDMRERKYYNPKFGGNLKEFIRRMVEDEGFMVGALFPYYEGRTYNILEGIDMDDYDEMAYRALNYEHTNIDFIGDGYSQTVSVLMTGDAWCDVIPINDWSFNKKREDVVDRVISTMRKEIMGDDA